MSITAKNTTELAMLLHLSVQASEKLRQRASESGRDVAAVASDIIERAISQPTVDEVMAPFRKQVAESNMSDQELDEFLSDVRDKAFQGRQRRPA